MSAAATAIGNRAARAVFNKRGNNTEVHVSEQELAIIVTAAVASAVDATAELIAAVEELAATEGRRSCGCSIREIESGHQVDCLKPESEERVARARAAIAKARRP